MIPAWYHALVLALAAFRCTRLTGWDTFPPVARTRAWVTGEKAVSAGSFNSRHGLTGEAPEIEYRYRWATLAEGLSCAYCAGLWWSVAWYVAWLEEPSWTLCGAFPLAVSTAVGTWARRLDP